MQVFNSSGKGGDVEKKEVLKRTKIGKKQRMAPEEKKEPRSAENVSRGHQPRPGWFVLGGGWGKGNWPVKPQGGGKVVYIFPINSGGKWNTF